MKNLIYLFAIGIIATFTAFSFASLDPEDTPMAYIEVTSMNEGKEVTFEGKFISYDSRRFDIQTTDLVTPYSFEVKSTDFVGVFRKLGGNGEMKVVLKLKRNEKESYATATYTGKNCLMIREDNNILTSGL